MRSEPSKADQHLLKFLTDKGLSVSSYRLERWRTRGLLPRAIVERRGFGGSFVPEHPDHVRDAAEILARDTKQGRNCAHAVVNLLFRGCWVRESTLQEAFSFFVVPKHLAKLIDESDSTVGGHQVTPYESLIDVGFTAADKLLSARRFRPLKLLLYQRERARFPPPSEEEVHAAATEALALRIADLINPGALSPDDERKARFSETFTDPDNREPLISELMMVARTLTLDEAVFMAREEAIEELESTEQVALVILNSLAQCRKIESNSITQPLSIDSLEILFGGQYEKNNF